MITWYAIGAALMAVTPTTTASVAADPGSAPMVAPAVAPPSAAPAPDAVATGSTGTSSAAAEQAPGSTPTVATPEQAPGSTPADAVAAPVAAPAAEAVAKAPESKFADRFAGSQAWFQTSTNIGALNKGLNQDYNPTVQSFLSLSPRFAINADWQVRARIGVNYEWTDSDTTSTRHVAQLTDTSLQLFYNAIPRFFGVKAQVAPFVVLPTSDASNTRTMRLQPGLLTQLSRGFELPGEASLFAIANASYQRPLYSYTTPGIDNERAPGTVQCLASDTDPSCQNQLSGLASPRDILAWTLILVGSWGDFSPGLAFQMSHQFPYKFSKEDPRITVQTEAPNGVRVFSSFSVWLDYTPLPWFTAELGYSFSRQLLNGNAQWGNVIWDKYQDGQLYLGFNFGLDTLYKTLTGDADEEGGVVRN